MTPTNKSVVAVLAISITGFVAGPVSAQECGEGEILVVDSELGISYCEPIPTQPFSTGNATIRS